MLNKERMLINACDVPNGKTNNMVKRDVKYTNPMSLQEASPRGCKLNCVSKE